MHDNSRCVITDVSSQVHSGELLHSVDLSPDLILDTLRAHSMQCRL